MWIVSVGKNVLFKPNVTVDISIHYGAFPDEESARQWIDDNKIETLEGYVWYEVAKLICIKPPTGWLCSREAMHEGPCTARPIDPRNLTGGF